MWVVWFVARVLLLGVFVVAAAGVGVSVWVDSQTSGTDEPLAVTDTPPSGEPSERKPGKGKQGDRKPDKPVVTEPEPAALQYVALGDSFTSGFGVEPLDPASGSCARSTVSYPRLVAQATGAVLVDVSCSGADTGDLLASQLGSLNASTDLVTLSIGGNNADLFAGTLQACGAAGAQTGGAGSPCEDAFGARFEDTIASDLGPGVATVLQTVKTRAPNARVAIVGYPWILPAEDGCFDVLPVAAGDLGYVRGIQAAANAAVEAAAVQAGVTFVDMSGVSDGRDLCADPAQQWMDPATVHPNAAGQAAMAAEVLRALELDNG